MFWRRAVTVQKQLPRLHRSSKRSYSTIQPQKDVVRIVEVSPRDGLQNEKGTISIDVRMELIKRLVGAGLKTIEVGSFVSPKWVPQMAGTADLLRRLERHPSVHYPVLVPNRRGLEDLEKLLVERPDGADEVAVFTAATEAFTKANTNNTLRDSIQAASLVSERARALGLRVRGYVSVVVHCPYSGHVKYSQVRDVAKALVDAGCYEISLGDTVGMARPFEVSEMVEEVRKSVPVSMLAGHFHDTFGTAVANIMAALDAGIRTIDASVGGLGGCPYSPGATGNVATEDVVYALNGSNYDVEGTRNGTLSLDELTDIGWWISEQLGRESVSRAGRAIRARRTREKSKSR